MNYKIIQFNQEHGVITIQYEDGIVINFDLPIVDGAYPDDVALEEMIQNVYPVSYSLRLQEAKNVSNTNSILSKVESLPIVDVPESTQGLPEEPAADPLEQEALLREEIISIVKQVVNGEI